MPTERREELAESAADYVLVHGLAALSLRPLAAALGTSDRMLVYHFKDKDSLVAETLERINDRVVAQISELPARRTVRSSVLALWDASTDPVAEQCVRVWLQAAGLGLLGDEPYRSSMRRSNAVWFAAIATCLERAGASERAARRTARIVSATMMGLLLDHHVDDEAELRRSVRDLADWAERACAPG